MTDYLESTVAELLEKRPVLFPDAVDFAEIILTEIDRRIADIAAASMQPLTYGDPPTA